MLKSIIKKLRCLVGAEYDKMERLDTVLKKLNTYEVTILSIDRDKKVVYAENFIAALADEDDSVILYFHVTMKPEDAAIISLIFREIPAYKSSKKIKIGDAYFATKADDVLWGDDAYGKYNEVRNTMIIKKYNKEKYQEEILLDDSKCFHC